MDWRVDEEREKKLKNTMEKDWKSVENLLKNIFDRSSRKTSNEYPANLRLSSLQNMTKALNPDFYQYINHKRDNFTIKF